LSKPCVYPYYIDAAENAIVGDLIFAWDSTKEYQPKDINYFYKNLT
jgi:hypothetical protein